MSRYLPKNIITKYLLTGMLVLISLEVLNGLQNITASKPSCYEDLFNYDVPIVYLTLSPISTVSWSGKIRQRQLVLNWRWEKNDTPESVMTPAQDGDWIGLFNYNVSDIMPNKCKKHCKTAELILSLIVVSDFI